MWDVGPVTVSEGGADDAELAVFVDRLAAAGADRASARARAQVRRAIADGAPPPGLRRLAEALAASMTDASAAPFPPAQRRPADDPAAIVAAVRSTPLITLEEFGPQDVAEALAALVADGRRVLVTAAAAAALGAVRATLPPEVADRTLDGLPPLAPADLRRLRGLLATSTGARRARRREQLPPAEALPPVPEVAELCRRATRSTRGVSTGLAVGEVIELLLDELEGERRDAVTSVARCVQRSLSALPPASEVAWPRALLSDLVHSRNRAAFDRMLEATAQATRAAERVDGVPPLRAAAPLPGSARDTLARYLEFLDSGGRSRQYFRPAVQREAEPVLRTLRIGDEAPETAEQVRAVLAHLELHERFARVQAGCAELDLPAPRDPAELAELSDRLVTVAAAARSVAALRHDVLFLHPNSPIAVPDLDAAEQIARAIGEYADHGSVADAEAALDRAAVELAGRAGVTATAPEHERAVAALRARDADAYASAVEDLVAARREVQDERRAAELLGALRRRAPRLADAWEAAADGDRGGLGLVSLVPLEQLLEMLPQPDTADVVVVLDATGLGVERLLLTAAAPRLIAVVPPGERPPVTAPSLLGVLHRAAALVIRRGAARAEPAGGRVVQFAAGGRGGPDRVDQAGV